MKRSPIKRNSIGQVDADEILPEYDFSRASPNKYASRYAAGSASISTSAIQVSLFKDSYQPFTSLLQEGGIKFNERTPPVGVPMNSGWAIEILLTPMICSAVAKVICAFLKNRRSRKVIITTHDNTVVHAEGLSQSDLERLIAQTKSMAAIETAREKAVRP